MFKPGSDQDSSLILRSPVHVAKWDKPWPADLVGLGLIPAGGRNLFNLLQDFIAHSLSKSPSRHSDMPEMLFKNI